MMAVSQAQLDFVTDLFSGVGNIRSRKMMGGLCIYCDTQIFAMLHSDDRLFLKASGDLAQELQRLGCEKFSFTRKDGRQGSMGYWSLPDSALDNPAEACRWGKKALKAAK